jgi:hypothetical protein
MRLLPDKRMRKVIENMLLGIPGGQIPVITGMARQTGKADGETWSVVKSMYRLPAINGWPRMSFTRVSMKLGKGLWQAKSQSFWLLQSIR